MAILRVYNPLTQSWVPIPYIKGDKGDRGYDVTTVEYEYYSSTSSSEPTGGEWATIMPGYSEGRYIWVRTKTTNSHGEVYTGTPVLATLFNDVNSAELSRRTYETNRVNAETARDTAEGLRDSAEIARASAELLRVSAETSRGNSEVSRANAEAQRVSAESSRVSVEAQRVANEEQRISNENARIAAQGRYPIVQNNTWWVWSKEDDDYVDTEVTAVGADGVGIASIELTSTVDLVDTYTITFDDGSTTTFDVTNGQDGISPTITVTEITGGHEVAVTDAQGTQTFDVLDGEVSEEQLETALIDKADVITSTASGEIVTIADGAKNLPVVDLKVSLLPVQSGSGDPSPSNIRPISGWTGADIRRTGKNLFGGTALRDGVKASVPGAVDHPEDPNNKYIAFASNETNVGTITGSGRCKFKPNTRYTFIMSIYKTSGTGSNLRVYYTDDTYDAIPNVSSASTKQTVVLVSSATKSVAYLRKVNQSGTTRLYYDESGIFEGVHTADEFKPYVGTTYPISWQSSAGTVYGGSLDLTTGVLTVTHEIKSFSGGMVKHPTLPNGFYQNGAFSDATGGTAWSNQFQYESSAFGQLSLGHFCIDQTGFTRLTISTDAYASAEDFNTALQTNPMVVVYPLAIPLTFQLSPTQTATFLGVNNFWSNSNGTIDLEYRCDTKLYIENLTKPSEDDMTANANIASGKFFMIGNRLMLSTTAIAQGEQIVVGTNCSEVSLADALNQINA